MDKRIEDILGGGTNPDEVTSDEENEEENPLKKMDDISKEKPKKGSEDYSIDSDVVTKMLKTGENTDGMFVPDKKEEHQDEDEKAKVSVGKKVTPSDKYKKDFKDDMLKHPNDYKIETPQGEMTVAEAIKAGYNPITKTFEKNHGQEALRKKHLDGLNEADRGALEQFIDPANAQVAPADAEMYGLQPGSPMIKQPPMEQPMMPGAQPATAPAPMAQPAAGSPIGNAMPSGQEQPNPMDLSALLGGGQ